MRILFVGDVVGRAGRTAISEYLPGMVRDWQLDFVVVIGIGFAAQEIPRVPATERDARLDLVLTEREIIDFRKA